MAQALAAALEGQVATGQSLEGDKAVHVLKQVHVAVQAGELLLPYAASLKWCEIVARGFAAEDQLDLPFVKDFGEIRRAEMQLFIYAYPRDGALADPLNHDWPCLMLTG